jgi:hypothetical protein
MDWLIEGHDAQGGVQMVDWASVGTGVEKEANPTPALPHGGLAEDMS